MNRDGTPFIPGADVPHVYAVRAGMLCCFHSRISVYLSECADSVGGQLRRGNKECPAFSDVINSGRVWRKVPESDARSVAGQVSIVKRLPLSQFCHFQIPAVSPQHWRNAVTIHDMMHADVRFKGTLVSKSMFYPRSGLAFLEQQPCKRDQSEKNLHCPSL